MDQSLYKDIKVSRGLTYHYYHSPAQAGKPVLLLLHGFPSTSACWKYQVAFFQERGYGLVVPDIVGYGGTTSPSDPRAYLSTLFTKDLIDILDAEKIDTAIAIGHDWGSKVSSRLANYFPDRFIAHAFFAAGYQPPRTENNYDEFLKISKKIYGFEIFGYWRFFSEPDAPKLVEDHFDSFFSLNYCEDQENVKKYWAPVGALRQWLEADKRTEVAAHVTPEELAFQKSEIMKSGMTGPSCWYAVETLGLSAEDNKNVPQENINITKPTFFGGCKKDVIVISDMQLKNTQLFCPNLTSHDFDAGHWLLWEVKDEVNEKLLEWIERL